MSGSVRAVLSADRAAAVCTRARMFPRRLPPSPVEDDWYWGGTFQTPGDGKNGQTKTDHGAIWTTPVEELGRSREKSYCLIPRLTAEAGYWHGTVINRDKKISGVYVWT